MKKIAIINLLGNVAFLVGSVFNLVNTFSEKEVFPSFIIIVLMAVALVGIVCGIVMMVSNKNKKD